MLTSVRDMSKTVFTKVCLQNFIFNHYCNNAEINGYHAGGQMQNKQLF